MRNLTIHNGLIIQLYLELEIIYNDIMHIYIYIIKDL